MSRVGIVTLNFGEPAHADPAEVLPFLERIFWVNRGLERSDAETARDRARQLARDRAPGLIAEYELIGGSPMNPQSNAHAQALEGVLRMRGFDVVVHSAFQFTDPLPDAIVAQARADGVERLIALPVYPLCGPSTTIAAFASLRAALERAKWHVGVREISGWHPHPGYVRIRADGIVETARAAGAEPGDARVALVFSAHGTPLKYLHEGSRYDRYVEENCAQVAAAAGWSRFMLGWQNHTNRPLEWTQPAIGRVIEEIDADAVIVVPISFMHEQSETLAELDHELRNQAEARGLAFHRVPVPHDDPRFVEFLADLCEPFVRDENVAPGAIVARRCGDTGVPDARCELRQCACRPVHGTLCLNGTA